MVKNSSYWPEIIRFLSCQATAGVAVVDAKGKPHAFNIWYAVDEEGRMYFVSSLDSAHSRYILREPQVALCVYGQTDDPMHIHGVQLKGVCTLIPPVGKDGAGKGGWDHAWKTFTSRFPFVARIDMWTQAVHEQCFFCITPGWARWLDNRKGFGFKVEVDVPLMGKGKVKKKGGVSERKAGGKKKVAVKGRRGGGKKK